ncbi:MAG: hypothetical protein JNM43_25080 [Planctomycetaceae bacterium]|nr:hypothetical protein [Planctomycetaceae bacterium]
MILNSHGRVASRTSLFAVFVVSIFATITLALTATATHAQSDEVLPGTGERFSGSPLVIVRNAKTDPEAAGKYIETLIKDLDLKAPQGQSESDETQNVAAGTNGMLLYLVPGVIPNVGTVTFREVKDREEFQALVLKAKGSDESAKLSEDGDTYTLITTTVTKIEAVSATSEDVAAPTVEPASLEEPAADGASTPSPDSQDAPKGSITIGVSAGTDAAPGVIFSVKSQEVRTDDAESLVVEDRRVFRYSDGFMFESTSDGLKTAELPPSDSLRQLENAEVFSEFSFFADRVPEGIKQLGWGMMSAGLGAELQQRDEESDADYEPRRALGDAQLIFLQSMIFDLQKVSGWVRMASEVEPLEAQVRLATRENSDLAKRLRELSASGSYFAPILNDDALVTFHVCLSLPEHWRKVVTATITQARNGLKDEALTPEAEQGWRDVLTAAEKTTEEGQLEIVVKYGWSEESGPVIYYGVHVWDAGNLGPAILQVSELKENVKAFDSELGIMAIHEGEAEDPVDAMLSTAFVATSSDAIWFALGNANGGKMLARTIRSCQESQQSIRTPLLSLHADMGRLKDKAVPAEEAGYVNEEAFLNFVLMQLGAVDGGTIESGNFSGTAADLFHRAGQLGGTQDAHVTVESDESGLIVRANAGAGLVRGFVALFFALADQ